MPKNSKNYIRFDTPTVVVAIEALLQHVENAATSGNQNFRGVQAIFVAIQLSDVVPGSGKERVVGIKLPHSPLHDKAEVCLITKFPGSTYSSLLPSNNPTSSVPPNLTKIIGLSELQKGYATPQAKQKLCESFALFLADTRICGKLRPILGRPFFVEKKLPVAISIPANTNAPGSQPAGTPQIAHHAITRNIKRALHHTYTVLRSGTCIVLKIGHSRMPIGELVDNIQMGVINFSREFLPGKIQINSVSIKTSHSTAIPVHSSSPSAALDVVRQHARKRVFGETSTDDQADQAAAAEESDTAKKEQPVPAKPISKQNPPNKRRKTTKTRP